MKAAQRTQISIFLQNRPGHVADLCGKLSDAGLSILAMTVIDTVDVGTTRLVVDDVGLARATLDGASVAYMLVPVISMELANRRGAFAAVARTLANAGVNVEYVYVTALPNTDRALAIFRVDDTETALQLSYPD